MHLSQEATHFSWSLLQGPLQQFTRHTQNPCFKSNRKTPKNKAFIIEGRMNKNQGKFVWKKYIPLNISSRWVMFQEKRFYGHFTLENTNTVWPTHANTPLPHMLTLHRTRQHIKGPQKPCNKSVYCCLIQYFFCIFDQRASPANPCKYLRTFWEDPWEMAVASWSTHSFQLSVLWCGGTVCGGLCVLYRPLGCQWLLSVTALMWQLWVAYFS